QIYCFYKSMLAAFCFSILLAAPALAGVIKIQTRTTVEPSENHVRITVKLTNEGTAAAYSLQVHLELMEETLDSRVQPQLDPTKSDVFFFEKNTQGVKAGRYPLTVFVDFHDANQYPFSALSGMTFSVGANLNPDLAVISKNITIDKQGELFLDIKNLGVSEKHLLASLALPRELSTPTPQIDFQMGPRSQKNLSFEIRNFSALPGANYPVFCYLEYDLKNVHHTALCQAVVKIIASENLFRRYRSVWIGLAGIFIAAFLFFVFRNRRKTSG
ncbi:conserved hypothetical protein, partial [delta proteobacterium NaphS2]